MSDPYPNLDLHPKVLELLEALEGRLNTRAEELAEAAEEFLEMIERADQEASAMKRLCQVAKTRGAGGEVHIPSLDAFRQVEGAAQAQQKHIARLRDEYDAVVHAMLTMDQKQSNLQRDLAKKNREVGDR